MTVRSMEPEKKELPGPLAKQRTTSEWPARDARMPRFSKPGILHILSAQSLHAVTSTCTVKRSKNVNLEGL